VGDSNDKASADSFVFEGLTLFGAAWKDAALALSNDVSHNMPSMRFTWVHDPNVNKMKDGAEPGIASVPVYLNTVRTNFLFSLRLRCPKDLPPNVWSQRGTCLTVWHHHS